MTTSTSYPQPASAPTAVDLLLNLYDVKITPEHEADYQQLCYWVRDAVRLKSIIDARSKTLMQLQDRQPRQPVEVTDYREWVIYKTRNARHAEEVRTLERDIEARLAELDVIHGDLKGSMASLVWFKVEVWAVGISSSWSGGSRSVHIVKWGEHTHINLDQNSTGD